MAKQFIKQSPRPPGQRTGPGRAGSAPVTGNKVKTMNDQVAESRARGQKRRANANRSTARAGGGGGSH